MAKVIIVHFDKATRGTAEPATALKVVVGLRQPAEQPASSRGPVVVPLCQASQSLPGWPRQVFSMSRLCLAREPLSGLQTEQCVMLLCSPQT